MWDLRSGVLVNTLRRHTSIVECLKFKGDTLVSGGDDKYAPSTLPPISSSLSFSLLTLTRTLEVWSLRTGVCMATMAGHGSWARCLQMSQTQSRVVSGSDDMTIKVCIGSVREEKGRRRGERRAEREEGRAGRGGVGRRDERLMWVFFILVCLVVAIFTDRHQCRCGVSQDPYHQSATRPSAATPTSSLAFNSKITFSSVALWTKQFAYGTSPLPPLPPPPPPLPPPPQCDCCYSSVSFKQHLPKWPCQQNCQQWKSHTPT